MRHPRRTEAAETIIIVPGRQWTATSIGVSLLCGYELAAIATGKVPTLSQIFRRHRIAEAAFIGWLLAHLHSKLKEAASG